MSQTGDIPENGILMTTEVVGLYPSIPHKPRLKVLKNVLDKRKQKNIPTEKLINVVERVLKKQLLIFQNNNLLLNNKFNVSLKQQV